MNQKSGEPKSEEKCTGCGIVLRAGVGRYIIDGKPICVDCRAKKESVAKPKWGHVWKNSAV